MKRITLIIVLFSLMLLPSCSRESNVSNDNAPKTVMMEEWYFYRPGNWSVNEHGEIVGYGPYKVNPLTKRSISICLDPLCVGADCPFYNLDFSVISGNYVFYTVGYVNYTSTRTGSVSLRVYDMVTGVAREIDEYQDEIYYEAVEGSYFYYSMYRYDEELGVRDEFLMYRADGRTGEVIEIPIDNKDRLNFGKKNPQDTAYVEIYAISDDKLYWERSRFGNRAYYTTDMDGQNKRGSGDKRGLSQRLYCRRHRNGRIRRV